MNTKTLRIGTVSAVTLILIWYVSALILNVPYILPSPFSVLLDTVSFIGSPAFAKTVIATCIRGLSAFGISFALSLVLGLASGLSDSWAAAIRPWMTIIKATPVISFILIALLWFGSSFVPVFVSILMTLPVMAESIAQGVRSTDVQLLEMSRVYDFSTLHKILYIRLPTALPFFLGGAGASLGLTWKVVVAGEILSSPKYGIGSALQTAKVHLETPRVFSLTILAILLSIITDILFSMLVYVFSARFGKKGV